MIMGEFHLFHCSAEEMSNDWSTLWEDDKPLDPLYVSNLRRCDHYSESFTMPTEVEIKDRGKSNWLTKFLVLL